MVRFDILPRPKERGFLLDGDVFMPSMNTMARGPYATLWHGLRAAKSRENVDRGVDIAIMMSSARGARPFSDTQTCSTFRTATGNVPTAGTGLRRISFIDDFKNHASLMALVLQHDFQSTPARVQRAFSRGSLQHPLTTDIANKNGPVLGYHRVAEFMQGILALIGNLGMNRTHAIFFPGPLRTGERVFLITIPMTF